MRGWAILGFLAVLVGQAQAAEYQVLHSFCAKSGCTDGRFPVAAPVLDGAGNLYGTTGLGGADNAGVIYTVARSGDAHLYRRLYSFSGTLGANPQAPLMLDQAGAVYGTAMNGGTRASGTFFKLVPVGAHWHMHVFHDFCSSSFCADGSHPVSGAFYAQSRNGMPYDGVSDVFGVTFAGGLGPYGVLYRWNPKFGEYVLKSFCAAENCSDGAQPNGDIAFNDSGRPCGTTRAGGTAGHGTLYCLKSDDTSWTYSFCSRADCADGSEPQSGVVPDGHDNVVGTTRFGGRNGQGVVYSVSTGPGVHHERVLYNFCRREGCADGKNPMSAVVLIGDAIYGTTAGGGKYDGGTIWRLDQGGRLTVLHSFCRTATCFDGYAPQAGLTTDGNGHLFGTATQGGRFGGGVVFELTL